jgi:CBS domain containing-hemolysin-like protein
VLAGDLPDQDGEQPDIATCDDGSFLIDGMAPAHDIFERLGVKPPAKVRFHTVAGFALGEFGHLPEAGEWFIYEGWRFLVVDMDGRRIDKLMARQEASPAAEA